MPALEEYWAGIGHWLQIQAESFNRLIAHNGEKGRANELTVADFLGRLLPPNLAIGSGLIIGADGNQSRQCDLIVHEVHKHPQLFSQTAQFVYPADTVVMTVEVKTTLDADEVASIGVNSASVRAARRAAGDSRTPLTAVFAFTTSASPHTTLKWFSELSEEQRPDIVCVVNPGLILTSNPGAMVAEGALLHASTTPGQRLSRTWREVGEFQSTALIEGYAYPVAVVQSADGRQRFIFEPGRALLLFSIRLLAGLGERGHLGAAWWDDYLDSLTRETVQIVAD